jgi:hypothetical protein
VTQHRIAARVVISALFVLACTRGQAGIGGLSPAESATPDPCGAVGTIQAEFDLPEGSDFWDVFPDAGLAPELEGRSDLHLIVYVGPVVLTNVSGIPGAPRETSVADAVCVILPSGDANLYYDIPRTRMTLPDAPSLP